MSPLMIVEEVLLWKTLSLFLVAALMLNVVGSQRRYWKCVVCLSRWSTDVTYVDIESASRELVTPRISSAAIRPLQNHLLSLSQDCSILHSGQSVSH